jgi:hypothetical protein
LYIANIPVVPSVGNTLLLSNNRWTSSPFFSRRFCVEAFLVASRIFYIPQQNINSRQRADRFIDRPYSLSVVFLIRFSVAQSFACSTLAVFIPYYITSNQ